MSDAPAVVPSTPARPTFFRRLVRLQLRLWALMALVALSALGIYGYQIYQDYALVAPQVSALRTGNTVAKLNALNTLKQYGRRAWLAERALIAASKDEDLMVSEGAIWTLIQVSPRSAATVRALVAALGARTTRNKMERAFYPAAVFALQQTGPASTETVQALGALARGGDSGLRQEVVEILSQIGTPTNGAGEVIREALEDRDVAVVTRALDALVRLDPEPDRALAAIRELARRPPDQWTGIDQFTFDPDPSSDRAGSVRRAVVGALSGMAGRSDVPPGLVEDLLAMLDDPIEDIRHAAGGTLARLGPAARRKAVAAYAQQLRRPGVNRERVREVALSLVRFDPENRGVLPALVQKLGASDPAEQMEAIIGLGTLGQSAAPAAPDLARALLGPDAWWPVPGFLESLPRPDKAIGRAPILARARAAKARSPLALGAIALRTIGERGQAEAVRILIDALDDPDPDRRAQTARALGALGPDARAAIPALKRALGDERLSVRGASRMALQKIERRAEAIE